MSVLTDLPPRFRDKVRINEESGCWIWTAGQRGGTEGARYGAFWLDGRYHGAHRVAYELLVGPIPPGLPLDHLCHITLCVNPAHLEPVTDRENLMRSDTFQARNAAKTHCINDHEFTPENTYIWDKRHGPERNCRACARERTRRYRAEKG